MTSKHKITYILISKSFDAIDKFDISFEYNDNDIPTFKLEGIHLDTSSDDVKQFTQKIMEISEEFEKDSLFSLEKFIDNPEYHTVSIMYNDIIIMPDLMNNLTTSFTHPKLINEYLDKILAACKKINENAIYPETIKNWYEEQLCKHLNDELKEKKFKDTLSKLTEQLQQINTSINSSA